MPPMATVEQRAEAYARGEVRRLEAALGGAARAVFHDMDVVVAIREAIASSFVIGHAAGVTDHRGRR